jgi:hypothetical protein
MSELAVLHQCALEQDLFLFQAGDATEVGEKGLTLRFAFTFESNSYVY